jgi:hypothetical protein
MPGKGPVPKDPEKRARRNAPPTPLRVLTLTPVSAPTLPDDLLDESEVWHPATLRWWQRWCESPLSDTWTGVDWSFLEETAVLHHEYMKKRTFTLGSELRLRESKMGATEEDRNRLRIISADADKKDDKRQGPEGSARQRYGGAGRAVGSD